MIEQPAPDRRHAIAFNALGHALNTSGHWLPFTARQTAVDAVLYAIDSDARDAARRTTEQTDTEPTKHRIIPVCDQCGAPWADGHTCADPTTADDPTPLRWGLGDVLHGDDDTVIVCLSGPDREPYWLELDADRAAALRDDLAPPTPCTCDAAGPAFVPAGHYRDCPEYEAPTPAVGQPAEAQPAAEAPADTNAAIEMWARLLNSADVHVYGNDGFAWSQLSPASRDQYRKVAEWLMGRAIVPPETIRAKVLREAADALDNSETLRDPTDDHMHDVHAAANVLRRMAEEARS